MIMKYVLPFLFLISIQGYSQGIKFGFNASYIIDDQVTFNSPLEGYHLLQLHGNTQYYLTPSHSLGLQYIHILTYGSSYKISEDKEQYYILGAFYQYDIIPKSNFEVFPEISLLYGNYCPCGKTDPYKVSGLVYFGYGLGVDIPLGKGFSLDLGLHYYRPILNFPKKTDIHAAGQYVLGIGYLIK